MRSRPSACHGAEPCVLWASACFKAIDSGVAGRAGGRGDGAVGGTHENRTHPGWAFLFTFKPSGGAVLSDEGSSEGRVNERKFSECSISERT